MPIVTVSSKGQVVIPKEIREKLDLREGAKVEVRIRDDEVVMRPSKGDGRDWRRWRGRFRGSGMLKELETEHAAEVARDRRRGP
jgi:AbrB family looped-hinge helix DNA binding protein